MDLSDCKNLNVYDFRIDVLEGHEGVLKIHLNTFRDRVTLSPLSKYLCTYEVSKRTGKPHYHILLVSPLDGPTVRNKWDYIFKQTHPGPLRKMRHQKECTTKELQRAFSYVYKDVTVNNPVHSTNLSKEVLATIPKWKGSDANHKSRYLDIIKWIDDKNLPSDWREEPRAIFTQIVKWHRAKHKLMSKHNLVSLTLTIEDHYMFESGNGSTSIEALYAFCFQT